MTTPVLIVSNYKIEPGSGGKFLHSFTPESTHTVYQFLANAQPLLVEGERYNIGYNVHGGSNWVDTSATAKADDVDPIKSFYVANILGEELRSVETAKSIDRVTYPELDSFYLGKKYAWRIYGMAIARDTFDTYLKDIRHPFVPCLTEGSTSIAYKEEGLKEAMKLLLDSLVHVSSNRYKSELVHSKKWFQVKGISSITDKK